MLGPTIQYLTPPDVDNGQPCVMRGTIAPGGVVALHSHPDPETFIALSGELEGLRMSAERFEWVPVRPGQALHVPPHARHAWRNPSRQPSVAIIVTTAALGRFLREIGTPLDHALPPRGRRRRPRSNGLSRPPGDTGTGTPPPRRTRESAWLRRDHLAWARWKAGEITAFVFPDLLVKLGPSRRALRSP